MAQNKISRSMQVYEVLREKILRGEFACGQKLGEDRVASLLHVSRTPIREAMRRLEADGLVVLSPGRFAKVVSFEQADLAHLGQVRISQDVLAVQLAVHYGSNADFETLRVLSKRCEDYAQSEDL